VHQAFILGAGLGTRLRPLTDRLPKPLVPLFHRPLVEWAMDACVRAGVGRFAINSHHLPEAWEDFGGVGDGRIFTGGNGLPCSSRRWNGMEVSLFHEPILLETGGGLKNIASWMGGRPVLVHNGDIYSSLPLEQLIAAHEGSGLPVTLAVRSTGPEKRVSLDPSRTRVTDLRSQLLGEPGTHVFTGIYCANPELLEWIPPGEKVQIIPAFLELARRGLLGAVVLDEGDWLDLGDRGAYLHAHSALALGPAIHPQAVVTPGAVVEHSVIGPGARVEAGAVVRHSVVWQHARILGDADIDGCVVCSSRPVTGGHRQQDL
jgi:mannose-1-phosphate guanylyltransferase